MKQYAKKIKMMKKLIWLFFALPFAAKAQEGSLMVQGNTGSLYLNHTAAAKESFYSIGRLYNISPKEIAPFNNTTLEKGLSVGQIIKIPLKANFIQTNTVAADEAAVPLYHVVEAKENLYQLSTKYNKVQINALKSWNNLQDESVSVGKGLIIGYLKVKKDLSTLSQLATEMPVVNTEVVKEKVEPKKEKVDAIKTDAAKRIADAKVKEAAEKKAAVVATKKVEMAKPKEEVPVVKKETVAKEVKRVEEAPMEPIESNAKDFNGGFFKSQYTNGDTEETGTGGVFKSTSGWEDGKYYCLHNGAQQGTIIKVTNKITGKSIYAKVLDVIPDLKQNNSLVVRVSNAAAEILGAGTNNFSCAISY
jgi:LysM domain